MLEAVNVPSAVSRHESPPAWQLYSPCLDSFDGVLHQSITTRFCPRVGRCAISCRREVQLHSNFTSSRAAVSLCVKLQNYVMMMPFYTCCPTILLDALLAMSSVVFGDDDVDTVMPLPHHV